jgi:hypothetical protein
MFIRHELPGEISIGILFLSIYAYQTFGFFILMLST